MQGSASNISGKWVKAGLGCLIAPKGPKDSARGFNPGDPGPRRRALKGRQIKRCHNTGQTCTHLWPFQGEPFVLDGSQG
jgi:hypothetical protein